jgi:hypothetical protein
MSQAVAPQQAGFQVIRPQPVSATLTLEKFGGVI